MKFSALDVRVINAVSVVARMILGGNHVDTVDAIRHVFLVAVDIGVPRGRRRILLCELPAVLPRRAVVVRIHDMRALLRPSDVIEPAITVLVGIFCRKLKDIGVCWCHPRPVRC